MIFYLVHDAKGDRHLKGTQAEARAINKEFTQIDIPVDKTGLMAAIQELLFQADMWRKKSHEIEGQPAPPAEAASSSKTCPRCQFDYNASFKVATEWADRAEADAIETWVYDKADFKALGGVANACARRYAELSEKALKAS